MEENAKMYLLKKAGQLTAVSALINRINRAQTCEDVAAAMKERGIWIGTVNLEGDEGTIRMITPKGEIMNMPNFGTRRVTGRELHAIISESDGIQLDEHSFNAERLMRLGENERLDALDMTEELDQLERILAADAG